MRQLPGGGWEVGVHIAAPALGIAGRLALDEIAAARLSTVYMPGDKITMLPDSVVKPTRCAPGGSVPGAVAVPRRGARLAAARNAQRVER